MYKKTSATSNSNQFEERIGEIVPFDFLTFSATAQLLIWR
jgi:hypothetical protein